jgi:hypothetical protein
MTATEKRHPHLHAYLQDKLPQLGLDVDTYGPYIWGGDDDDGGFDDLNGEDAATSLTKDPDELLQVVELLQASSETHSDDENVWKELFQEIQEQIQKDIAHHQQEHQRKLQQTKAAMEEQLERAKQDKEAAAKAQQESSKTKLQQQRVDDETKRLLMQRFGYEEPDEDLDDEAVPSNKQVASQMNLEKAQQQRSQHKQTKKEEQQKTKQAKLDKEKLKEERRNRTQKGERKR